MIIYPPLENLLEKVNNRYSLVIATAKRARELTDNDEVKEIEKPVINAVNEIHNLEVIIVDDIPTVEKSEIIQAQELKEEA